ncbi:MULTISPECIES: MFS transporter [Thermomonosporaceae]|uniref:MFS transporter n=1 Tax=Thermomonosporaceae TaxID=2012 RepID=UPI00255B2C85|nr:MULTISPECIES: MFS transporter [Thermomonosporaceae]MDL4771110.1 MFS transporter [Actinomadura xylanilytica]
MTTAHTPRRTGVAVPDGPAAPSPSRWWRWLHPKHPVLVTTITAAVLHLVWALFLANEGGDLAAQTAWTNFAWDHPSSAYSLAWYGGMHPASYSIVSPYLMSVFGIRAVAMVAGTLTAMLTAHLLVRFRAPAALPAGVWVAFALTCNAASGRVTFGLGLLFALLATVVAFTRRGTPLLRGAGMGLLGILATISSPVAGLFLMVLAAALILTGRRRAGIALALGPPLVVGATTVVFPFSGEQPISFAAIVAPSITSVIAIMLCAPRQWHLIRVGAGVYLVGILLTWTIPTPIGSNVERLALLFGGMLLLIAVARAPGRLRVGVLSLAFVVTAVWQVVKPVDDLIHTEPAASASRHARGLVAELDALGAAQGRVEVVPLRSHWESSGLSRDFVLARGWSRQVDAERNELFYKEGALTPASYRDWLHKWAVQYVVLPEQENDWAAEDEADLVRQGQPWLQEVWKDRYWRLYRVASPTPLADRPAVVQRIRSDEVVLDMTARGTALVRISWSPWLSVRDDEGRRTGCIAAEGDFVRMHVPAPGRYHIGGRYELPRGTPCKD